MYECAVMHIIHNVYVPCSFIVFKNIIIFSQDIYITEKRYSDEPEEQQSGDDATVFRGPSSQKFRHGLINIQMPKPMSASF
jgi:hypothetical protein